MAGRDRQRDMLATIFSFFLGLMVLAFIGVGVNTALPDPSRDLSRKNEALYRQQSRLEEARGKDGNLPAAQQAEYDRIQAQIDAAQQKTEDAMKSWARDTSIVLIVFATIVMGISLIRSEQLRLISNGLLLGGLFTMLYGTGWSIFSGDDWVRFGVIAFALVVTVGLGYAKFVRARQAEAETAGSGATAAPNDAALGGLSARVARLEARAAAAAAALGADDPHAGREE